MRFLEPRHPLVPMLVYMIEAERVWLVQLDGIACARCVWQDQCSCVSLPVNALRVRCFQCAPGVATIHHCLQLNSDMRSFAQLCMLAAKLSRQTDAGVRSNALKRRCSVCTRPCNFTSAYARAAISCQSSSQHTVSCMRGFVTTAGRLHGRNAVDRKCGKCGTHARSGAWEPWTLACSLH